MDQVFQRVEALVSNAKKSLNRPYSIETVEAKIAELRKLEEDLTTALENSEITGEERGKHLIKFEEFRETALELLEQHQKKGKRQGIIMATLDMNELSTIIKLIPIFTGKRDELQNFITNLEIVSGTVVTEKQVAFFNFIFKSRLDLKVQNRIKQGSIPTSVSELIDTLKLAYKSVKSSNAILNEITRIVQKGDNVMGFANKIENLITELNEIQISEEGESKRPYIISTNRRIAFNAFVNGLTDPQIVSTIDASQVTTFTEAVVIAEKASTRVVQKKIFYQSTHSNNNNNNNNNSRRQQGSECNKCGGVHGNKCPAYGTECFKCRKFNHFKKMCFSNAPNNRNYNNNNNGNNYNNNRRNDNSNNYNRNNNNGYRGNNNRGNNNQRNRNVNHVHNQGNSQTPETTRPESPEGNN